jgi:hypothetical protein
MMFGPKRIENRNWSADYMVGETFAMHASAKWDRDGEACLLEKGILVPPRSSLPKSAIIGINRMVRCVKRASYELYDEGRRLELVPEDQEQFFFGDFGFLLDDRQPISPISYPGSLGFFEIAPDIEHELRLRLGKPVDALPTPILPQQSMPWEPPGGLHSPPHKALVKRRGRR